MYIYTVKLTSDQMVNLRLALQSRVDLCEERVLQASKHPSGDAQYWVTRGQEALQLLDRVEKLMPEWTPSTDKEQA
jgi:hypothetical protein